MKWNTDAKIIDIQNARGLVDDLEQLLEKYGIPSAELELCLNGDIFAHNYSVDEAS